MKVLVAYATVTGNTAVIARAIASAIPGADLKKLPADVNPHDYDFIFAGFWCDKGTPDEVWQAFQKEAKAKPIAYFGTMGGDPNSERGQAWVNKVAGLFPCENFKGLRVWQGKIDPKILAAMAKMPGAKPMTPERQARLDEAAKHPTAEDQAQAGAWALEFLENFRMTNKHGL